MSEFIPPAPIAMPSFLTPQIQPPVTSMGTPQPYAGFDPSHVGAPDSNGIQPFTDAGKSHISQMATQSQGMTSGQPQGGSGLISDLGKFVGGGGLSGNGGMNSSGGLGSIIVTILSLI